MLYKKNIKFCFKTFKNNKNYRKKQNQFYKSQIVEFFLKIINKTIKKNKFKKYYFLIYQKKKT